MQYAFKSKRVEYEKPPLAWIYAAHIVLFQDFVIRIKGHPYTIPAGTMSNFASVPWLFWWIVRPDDPILRIASIVHDHIVGEFTRKQLVDWHRANRLMYEIVKAHCPDPRAWWDVKGHWARLKRHMIYRAVKLHGQREGKC